MRRLLTAAGLSAALAPGGCATHRPPPPDTPAAAPAAPKTEAKRPRWVQHEWLDEHPVAKAGVFVATVLGVVALVGGILYLAGQGDC
jgi:hypothetical protein